MMAELANCEYCDKVFAKINRSICPDCMKEEEKKYERVVQFLRIRKNRQATITEISEATEVEHEIILQFVKDKRLRRSQFPNLYTSCERCGEPVSSGVLCDKCKNDIKYDLKKHHEIDQIKQRNEEDEKKIRTYFTKD